MPEAILDIIENVAGQEPEQAAEVVAQLDSEVASVVVESLDPQKAAQVIEILDEQTATEIVDGVESSKAAKILEAVEIMKVKAIVESLETDKAAEIVEATETGRAVEIIEAVETMKAAEIVERLETAKGAEIIGEAQTDKAAGILEEVATSKAADIMASVTTAKATSVLSQVEPRKAGSIFEEIPTVKLTEVVQSMREDKLVERLPEMSASKLFEISTAVLFEALPAVPAEQLAPEIEPTVEPGLPEPVRVQIGPNETLYTLPEVAEQGWSTLVGSPGAIDRILGKFTRKLVQVSVRAEELPLDSSVLPPLPPTAISYAAFRIEIANAQQSDISAAHVTLFVEKSWLEANGVHKWSIQLNRFDDERGLWVSFPSKRVREDEQLVYYTAVLPGFSTIVIAGSRGLPEQVFEARDLTFEPSSPEGWRDGAYRVQSK